MSASDIGEYLKELREACGLSQKDVYSKTKITDSRLSRIENGDNHSPIDATDLRLLAKLYDVSVVSLFLRAGYLTTEDLAEYQKVFHRVEFLTPAEHRHTQEQINLFTAGRNKNDI